MTLEVAPDGTTASMAFFSSIMSNEQAASVAATFAQAIQEIMKNPQRKPTELDLCSHHDRNILSGWNKNIPERLDSRVHEMIFDQGNHDRSHVAVSSWDGELTYGELDRLSSSLAGQLAKQGVRCDMLVPICFEKSKWTVIAMLGVIKAGGAYVLLHPSNPVKRMESICQDIDAKILLASTQTIDKVRKLADSIVVVDETSPIWSDNHVWLSQVHSQNALYATFTSGSTGRPKGIVVEHGAFCTRALANGPLLKVNKYSRVLQFASYGFDVCHRDILLTLIHKGTICIPSEADRINNLELFINRHQVNWASLTPSVAALLDPGAVPTLQTLVLVGEAMSEALLSTWADKVQLMNAYGSSEGIAVSCINPRLTLGTDRTNIGRGIGSAIWIVDPEDVNRLAPIGAIGELVIETTAICRGYLKDQEKTEASFLDRVQWRDDFQLGSQGQFFKTGDLGRFNADGTICFMGRKDNQVKIYGQRVELAEIEHHMLQALTNGQEDASTIQVVVEMVMPEESQRPALVAFIYQMGNEQQSEVQRNTAIRQTTAHLAAQLAEILPVYMIPSVCIPVERIPMTETGKKDRRALRHLGASMNWNQITALIASKSSYQAQTMRDQDRARPQTEAECQLRDLWASVLEIPAECIGIDDSFFRLGGDSITAMRLVAAARRHGVSLMVHEIFSYPQLKSMATVIKDTVAADDADHPFSLLNLPLSIDEKRAQAAALCGLEPSMVQDAFSCTPLQADLLAATAQSSGDYIVRKVFQLRETTDVDRLAKAWEEIVALTPILRTRIVDFGSQGLVQININEEISWKIESDLGRYIRADSEEPMSLGTPLTRFGLVDCGMQKYCILTLHHAIHDGWLMSLLLQALNKAYHGQARLILTPFQHFIKAIYSADEASTADFWKAQLHGLEAPIFPSVSAISPRTDSYAMYLIEALRVDSGDTTLAMAIRAAWAILSARYVNASEALFGATVTGRQCSVAGIELVGGPTIAIVPVRVAVDGESTVEQFLQQVQAQAVETIPFEQCGLRRIRRVSTDAEQACQFQTLLVVQHADPDCQETPFMATQRSAGLSSVDPYALVLECKLLKQGVRVKINFDSRIIEEKQVERLSQQFDHVLRQVCAGHQTTKVKNIDIMSDIDMYDIWKWNAHLPTAQGVCVQNLIMEKTRNQREAPAVDAWDGCFTYGQLDELSTRLAHSLSQLGVGPEIFVPLLFEKSRWTAVAMLGVIKAGGAFVLLEPNHPLARLQDICAEVNAQTVVSSPEQAAKAANLATTVVKVGDGQDIGCDGGKLTAKTTPNNTLYAVFTSGSTGKPKGVLVHHDGFATNALAYNYKLGFGSNIRTLQFSSHAFDMCISNMLFTLIGGGCICIPSSSESMDVPSRAIRQFSANFTVLTPSVLRIMLPSDAPTLTTVSYAGEAASKTDILTWCDSVRLINAYGPAECSVIATMQSHITADSDPLNIGSPLAGVCWVVSPADSNLLVPVGAVGELLLEGPLVGQGYINNASKTAEVFLDSPPWLVQGYGDQPGRHGRVYKTGDLVRYASDGTLQFIGRKDTQVKLRGQRIELGEVEHHIHQMLTAICRQENFDADALEVVAEIVRPQETGHPTLVAFASLRKKGLTVQESTATLERMVAHLDEQLAERLPAYMVPSTYFPLERIPLGTTGKTDRGQLREIGSVNYSKITAQRQQGQRIAPSTEMEFLLLEVWTNVLNLPAETISVDSAWIRLGGDSITAMQLVSRCRARNIRLTAGDVLRARTIQRLARSCSLIQQSAPVLSIQTIEEEPWGLAPSQHLFFETHPDGLDYFNQSLMFRIRTPVSMDGISTAIHTLAERHPMLRARFRRGKSGDWQQYLASYHADVIAFATHNVERAAVANLAQSRQEQMDIQHGPVFAADVFCLPSGEQILLISAHHLVIDLVSWRVIWYDIEQSLRGRRDAVMRPTTSFQTWCEMQNQMAQSLMPSQVLPFVVDTRGYEYWGVDAAQNTEAESEIHVISLDEDVTTRLLGQSNERLGTEPTEIFLAMLFQSFQQVFADRPLPPIFVEEHGREAPEDFEVDLSETVGWFATIFPIHVSSKPNDNIVNMTKLAKDNRRSVPGRGLPYMASRYLTPDGQTAFREHQKVEVLFKYAGTYQKLENDDSILSRETDSTMERDLSQTSSTARRVGLIELNLDTQFGRLNISCSLHRHMKHKDRLQQWIKVFAESLTQAAHELSAGPKIFSLSDFPLLSLSYSGLESLERTIQAAGTRLGAVEDIYPCTPMQEGILLSMQKGTSSYLNHQVWRCEMGSEKSPVCPAQLEAAWRCVVKCHSILSTVFVPLCENSLFAQVVVANAPVRVDQIRCESRNPADTLMKCEKPVFADGEPHHHLRICQSSSGEVACRLDINHALSDAESASTIINDLTMAYEGLTLSVAPRFKELMQYLRRIPAADRMEYWDRVLKDVSRCHFPVQNISTGVLQGQHGYIPLAETATSRIRDFCINRGITRSVFIQIAWAMTLSWYTGTDDVCFGYLASGRDVPIHNIEGMVGPLANMLISRIDVGKPLDEAIETTAESSIENLAHQYVSLARIQHELRLGHEPLFDSCVTVRRGGKAPKANQLRLQTVSGDDPHEVSIPDLLMISANLA